MKKKYIAKPFPEHVIRAVYNAQGGLCAVEGCNHKIVDYHHRKPNSRTNNKLYPLFIPSIFNCKGLCTKHHTNYAQWNITDALCRAYEEGLERFMTDMPFTSQNEVNYEESSPTIILSHDRCYEKD